jgi:hypothetical protein
VQARRTILKAREAALNIELDEARHSEHARDEQAAQMDHYRAQQQTLMQDPVTNRIANLLHVTTDHIDLAIGLGVGTLLKVSRALRGYSRYPSPNHYSQ